jgi:hypothetical protein
MECPRARPSRASSVIVKCDLLLEEAEAAMAALELESKQAAAAEALRAPGPSWRIDSSNSRSTEADST